MNTPRISVSNSRGPMRREIVGSTCDGAPWHEALAVGGQRADAGVQAVGDDKHRVGAEQRGDLGLVGLELLEGGFQRGVLVGRVLQFDHADGQAVDEHHHVGAAILAVLDHRELVDGEPVVRADVIERDQPDLVALDDAVVAMELDIDAFGHQPMDAAVLLDERGRLRVEHAGDGFGAGAGRNGWVQPIDGGFQPLAQDHVAVARALGAGGIGRDVGAVRGRVAEGARSSSEISSTIASAKPGPL